MGAKAGAQDLAMNLGGEEEAQRCTRRQKPMLFKGGQRTHRSGMRSGRWAGTGASIQREGAEGVRSRSYERKNIQDWSIGEPRALAIAGVRAILEEWATVEAGYWVRIDKYGENGAIWLLYWKPLCWTPWLVCLTSLNPIYDMYTQVKWSHARFVMLVAGVSFFFFLACKECMRG
jgi:hypothetical protein